MKKLLVCVLMSMVFSSAASATTNAAPATPLLEGPIRAKWCTDNGGSEKPTYLKNYEAYPDCIVQKYAIEVDFIEKWAEAIGQSLAYAAMMDLEPGILFIIRRPEDYQQLRKFYEATKFINVHIRVWYWEAF